MPRKPRLHVPGGIYHVVLRGNHRQPIFFGPRDYESLDQLVAAALVRFECRLHAYCWMTNHIHMALQVAGAPLGQMMQWIASQYARAAQKQMPTTGHLFERRYRACLVNGDRYLLALIRYIHMNPVRAGIVTDPASYAWSSHRAYLGLGRVNWLTTDATLAMFATELPRARRSYGEFIGAEPEELEIQALRSGSPDDHRVLGDDAFVAALPAANERKVRPGRSLEDVVHEVSIEMGVNVIDIAGQSKARTLTRARAEIARRAVQDKVATLSAVARRLNRSPSSLCELLARRQGGPGC